MKNEVPKSVIVIVAHPDDETLWAGGTILLHPTRKWFVLCLSRGNDKDRAPRFFEALKVFNATGVMGDLDDGPNQIPLTEDEVESAILQLFPQIEFDLIITHNPNGEYTRHLRHEEVSKAVITLWKSDKIKAKELWTFAYEDGNKQYLPQPIKSANLYSELPKEIWQEKYNIITQQFGFDEESWEAKTTTLGESFWRFTNPIAASQWLKNEGKL